MKTRHEKSVYESPAALVAVAVGCQRSGDREMVRIVLDELHKRYGIKLTFAKSFDTITERTK